MHDIRAKSCALAVGPLPPPMSLATSSLPPSSSAGAGPAVPGPSSSHRLSLESLPIELLQHIIEVLAPTAPSTTRFALQLSGTWVFHDAATQYAEWQQARAHLFAVLRTSRRMAAVAKPMLWNTLIIATPRALVRLFVILHYRPDVRPWIHSITCFLNISSQLTIQDALRQWQLQFQRTYWPAASGDALTCGAGPFQNKMNLVDTVVIDLLRMVLMNAPNVRDFLLAPPDHGLRNEGPNDLMMPSFRAAIDQVRQWESPPPYGLNSWHTATLALSTMVWLDMKNLTSMRIYCHRENGNRSTTLSRFLADYAVVYLLPKLTQVKTLELCCASADNVFLEPTPIPPLPHIQHLRLYGSHIHEPRLVELCLACVNLRTLVVHFESSSTDEDRDLLPGGKTLSDALAGLAGTLETLELVALSTGHYLTRGRERPRKPENHRLHCIPRLTRLRNLTLDYRGVFGTLGILEMDDGERLCQLIPASVRDFTLVCEWGTASDWKQTYQANLDMVLHGVQCLCASKVHSLRSISLAIHSWPAKGRFHRRFKRDVETARQQCARAGIRFRTFDLLPSYQDEDEPEPEEEEGSQEVEFEEGGEEAAHGITEEDSDEPELEEEDEASEYYFSDEAGESDPEREARRPPTFQAFLQMLGEGHGYNMEDLWYAYHEGRWDEYLFDDD